MRLKSKARAYITVSIIVVSVVSIGVIIVVSIRWVSNAQGEETGENHSYQLKSEEAICIDWSLWSKVKDLQTYSCRWLLRGTD